MTDRELLGLAAKAAGIQFCALSRGGARYAPRPGIMQPYVRWNPLADDGDALQLAVHAERFLMADFWSRVIALRGTLDFLDSPVESTRRAIVLAAAEIGRSMK